MELLILDPKLKDNKNSTLIQASQGAAAYDLCASISQEIEIKPGSAEMIPTGIAIHIEDPTVCGILAPRSGLGTKHGIILGNSIGVIDSDYMGEIKVSLWNRSDKLFILKPYERICQLLFVNLTLPKFKVVDSFSKTTKRGKEGFGSTG